MRFLLDTHTLLWWLYDDQRLSEAGHQAIANPTHEILVSAASAWEIATKHRLGKLPVAKELLADFFGWITQAGFRELPITLHHGQMAGSFPSAHRDPFDRMLAAQGQIESMPLITRDPAFADLGVETIW